MSPFTLALDQGTIRSRALSFDDAGQIRDSIQQEFRQIFLQFDWAKHNANERWQSLRSPPLQRLIENARRAAVLPAIAITRQREPPWCGIAPATSRSAAGGKTANFFGAKIKWIFDHVASVDQKTERGQRALAPWIAG